MERLCDQLGETVSLVILEGNSTRVVDGVESKQAIRVGLRARGRNAVQRQAET
jgi:DNA-binding IclR family transcriptional regulator